MSLINKPIIINLFAGPGAGKSTIAAETFAALKRLGVNTELCREFAKEEVWANHPKSFKNQLYISGIQTQRQVELEDEVDVIVTDSPIILGCVFSDSPNLQEALLDTFMVQQRNLNYFIKRTKPYQPKGRRESETAARELDLQILSLLEDRLGLDCVPDIYSLSQLRFRELVDDRLVHQVIVKDVLERLKREREG